MRCATPRSSRWSARRSFPSSLWLWDSCSWSAKYAFELLWTQPLAYSSFPKDANAVLSSISVFSCALCYQTGIPVMMREVHYVASSRFPSKVHYMDWINLLASSLAAFLYYVVGLFGYFAFGPTIQDNILANFSEVQLPFVSLVKAAYAVVMICSNPIIVYPSLLTIDKWLFVSPSSLARRLSLGFVWSMLVWFAALMIPRLTVVFGITGSTGGFIIMFILPAIYYICVFKRARRSKKKLSIQKDGRWQLPVAYGVLVGSVVLGVAATVSQMATMNGE